MVKLPGECVAPQPSVVLFNRHSSLYDGPIKLRELEELAESAASQMSVFTSSPNIQQCAMNRLRQLFNLVIIYQTLLMKQKREVALNYYFTFIIGTLYFIYFRYLRVLAKLTKLSSHCLLTGIQNAL